MFRMNAKYIRRHHVNALFKLFCEQGLHLPLMYFPYFVLQRDYAISFPQECGQSIKHSIFCDAYVIRNHIWLVLVSLFVTATKILWNRLFCRLLEGFDANEDALNLSIISFLQLVSFHGHDKYLHKLSNMKTMYQVAGGKLFFTTLLQEDQHSYHL